MIATILPGSSNFHAVGYNERKVSKGVARLIEILNFGSIGTFGKPTPDELVKYLQEYSSSNERIQKAQFHLAISCKGKEMSENELLDFAHKYLKEMGYMEPGQPILVYSHYDTSNTHLHIVTSRIDPNGKKINHDNERRRSQEVIERILGTDRRKKVEKDYEAARQYTFSSFAQFKAVMSSIGYEVYEKDDTVYVKRGGRVQMKVPSGDFNALYKYGATDKTRVRQLRSILMKYRDTCTDKEELKKELKSKLGVDIIFFGKKDTPYGYMLVDHNRKMVFHGARILAVNELLDFATPQERFDRIEAFIDDLFTLNPKITQGEIHDKLWRKHAYIKKGVIYFNVQTRPLKQFLADAIARNGRIKWIEDFNPMTEAERDVLCRAGKGTDPSFVSLSSQRYNHYTQALNLVGRIFADMKITDVRGKLSEDGFIIKQDGDNTFAINLSKKIIINLTEEGFDLSRLKRQYPEKQKPTKQQQQKQKKSPLSGIRKLKDVGGGGQSEKREWEVGYKGDYDRIDDGQSLKM